MPQHLWSHRGPRQHVCSLGETSKIDVWGPIYNPRTDSNCYHGQSVSKLQLCFHVNAVRLSCKTWNAAKPGACLARPHPGAQQSQDPSPVLSKAWQVLRSQQAATHCPSQSGQCPARLEARSEACAALSPKPKQDYSFNFPNRGRLLNWVLKGK